MLGGLVGGPVRGWPAPALRARQTRRRRDGHHRAGRVRAHAYAPPKAPNGRELKALVGAGLDAGGIRIGEVAIARVDLFSEILNVGIREVARPLISVPPDACAIGANRSLRRALPALPRHGERLDPCEQGGVVREPCGWCGSARARPEGQHGHGARLACRGHSRRRPGHRGFERCGGDGALARPASSCAHDQAERGARRDSSAWRCSPARTGAWSEPIDGAAVPVGSVHPRRRRAAAHPRRARGPADRP